MAATDREVLQALNKRLELVRRVQAHKQETGQPTIDAKREAELLKELLASNAGPLSESAVQAVFTAVLDVMKRETQAPRRETLPSAPASAAVERLAIVGAGLVGTSVALAARRSGVRSVRSWDADPAHADAPSLEAAVADAELVVVAVPVSALFETTRDVLAATSGIVTDVGSTKRALAEISDLRLVPGHPLAGGSTGGPARAAADLFDGATWFLTPLPTTAEASVQLVERFVGSLGAHPVRLEADEHDRLLALTSHLPHALANLLMRAVAGAGENALGYAGASLREMTRVAGANAAVWTDVFVENGDLIADALAAHGSELAEVERALRSGDRDFFERWIAEAAAARDRMLGYAYRTEAKQLNRIRVRIPDTPGVLARITQTLGAAGINIEDFELRHVSPEYGGVLVILISGADNAELARNLLRREGYSAA
ncbi:MAG TPA: prephenate dehydrogenase/arogenate dehydrogenase family protein [Gaiellaceae bacterium]|nr:prephenate dehydrogenase/arogenate dehydrogenase family protein [Gaiellaceae bacterium]